MGLDNLSAEDSPQSNGFVPPSGDKDREVGDDERQLAKHWGERIRAAQKLMGPWYKRIKKYRKYVRGSQGGDGEQGLVRANLVHAHIKKAVNKTYARNPQFSIRPVENINPSAYEKVRLFGKTAEILLNRYLDDADLKRRGKACLRAAKTTGLGWVKVYYQTTMPGETPIMKNRMKDALDDLEQLRLLDDRVADDQDVSDRERKVLELENLISSLTQESEKILSEGLVIDVVDPSRVLLDLATTQNFDDYPKTPFIAEEILMSVDDVKRRWGKVPKGTKTWSSDILGSDKDSMSPGTQDSPESKGNELVKIWEIWDARNKIVHYLPDGADEFIQEPLKPQIVGEQWFPYFPLATNIIDGQFYPISDVELLTELQDEHNSSRTRFSAHKDLAIPHWVAKSEDVSEADAKKIASAKAGQVVLVEGAAGRPIRESIEVFSSPPIDPAVYSTDHTERDIERVAGGGDVTQPKSNRSRTLGEAELLTQDTGVQITADSDEVEDWFRRLAKHSLELLLQVVTVEQAVKIVGPLAKPAVDPETGEELDGLEDGTVWPETSSKQEIFNLLKMQIQAGSSGKPNVSAEAKLWTQFIMPKVTELISQVAELREKKQEDLADSLIAIAQETIRRMDERFDVEEFIPRRKPNKKPDPEAVQQQQKKDQAEKLQFGQMQADIEETLSKAAKNKAEVEKIAEEVKRGDFKDSLDTFKARTKVSVDKQKMADRQEETAASNAVKLAGSLKSNTSE